MRVFAIVAAALLAIAPVTQASAADITKSDITQILSEQGYNVRDFDNNKVVVNVGGYSIIVGVQFGDITYLAYLPGIGEEQISLKLLNEFNNEVKFARAYVDRDGDIAIQMDRNSGGGISAANIESDFDIFLLLVWTFLNDLESQRIA